MSFSIEELDYQQTPLGDISLRRRSEPRLGGKDLYEVKLGEEFLMSSLFVEAEIQLSRLALLALEKGPWRNGAWDVVVGGLGLGYTAAAALEHQSVNTLQVIDVMAPVIDWHQRGLVPLGERLTSDDRCYLQEGDFFAIASSEKSGFEFGDGLSSAMRQAHAVLLDIDHSPSHWLNPQNAGFYSQQGLQKIKHKLHPGGLFGLWSNDPPEADFMCLLGEVFEQATSHIVSFANPYSGGESTNTVYLAHKA